MSDDMIDGYRSMERRGRIRIAALLLIVVAAFSLTLSLGKYEIGIADSYRVIWDHIRGEQVPRMDLYIVWESRLPRAITAVTVGAGLAVSGCAMQYILRNPLADPYTTGISSGAGLGASLSIVLGFSLIPGLTGEYSTVVNAFVFSLLPASLILLSARFRRITPTMMILIGIGVMYLFSACSTMVNLSANPDDLADVYEWNVGTLGKADWGNVPFTVAAMLVGVTAMLALSSRMDVVSLDGRMCTALGEDAARVRTAGMLVLSLTTAVMCCFTGTIGFVGLVAPHIARRLVGNSARRLIPASAVTGAALLECADCLAKVIGPSGLAVGVVMSMIGGPVFLLILLRKRGPGSWRSGIAHRLRGGFGIEVV